MTGTARPLQRLSSATLRKLAPGVEIPRYDRRRVRAGIAHIGVGAFHRAHQAALIDDCLARGEMDWGIVGASLRSSVTKDALEPQNGLYTLAIRSPGQEALRVIGSIGAILVADESPVRLLSALADPAIRLLTLTITEKGYLADLASGNLRADHPDILHDLARPSQPRSAIGYIVEAIACRRAAGLAPLTVLSCDNIPSNGKVLHALLREFATARDAELGRYVAEDIAVPSSMVDRIVPATRDADREAISLRIGAEDAWPVITEPFCQWVIEDRFPSGRPKLEESGVEFVPDVAPFERMKLRLLNGAHTAIAAIGRLAGLATVAEAFSDRSIRRYVRLYWDEALPTLDLPASTTREYVDRLIARFDNSALQHATEQIARDASQKLPQRILAPLQERLGAGERAPAMTFAVAAWMRSCAGHADTGERFAVDDPNLRSPREETEQRMAAPADAVSRFLRMRHVFGSDLSRDAAFTRDLEAAYTTITEKGVCAALRQAFP